MGDMKKSIFYFLAFISILLFVVGCANEVDSRGGEKVPPQGNDEDLVEETIDYVIESTNTEQATLSVDWKEATLKDVRTGESFKISDFSGKPILLESFAVWCPTCKRQQDKIKELHEELGDSIVSISLDTDPSEDESKIIAHVDRYNFDWRFTISPKEVTESLIAEFGINVVNAPSAPIVLICKDQSARLLKFGVKDADELKEEIEKGC